MRTSTTNANNVWLAGLLGVAAANTGCETGTCAAPGVDCDVSLTPPENGVQIYLGPVDIPEGTEVLRCFWRKVPRDLDVTEINIRYNTGSHHIDIYTVPYAMPDGDFDCSRPQEWNAWPSEIGKGGFDPTLPFPDMMMGFQNDTVDWKLPDSVAFRLRGGQQLLVQSHFANVASQDTPTGKLVDIINFNAVEVPVADDHVAETLFDEQTDIFLPAHRETTLTRICEFPEPVTLIALFGHFHSRGVSHRIYAYDPTTEASGDLLYENTVWDEPPFFTDLNFGTQVVGGLKMEATYFNAEDRDIVWGNYVEENEHFESYAMWYPNLGIDPMCACHVEGEPPLGEDCQ